MLKMVADAIRGPRTIKLVVLGLSHQNLKRLKAGEPIIIKGADVHLPDAEILIFSGETERSMTRELAELIGPDTAVHIDPRLRD